MLSLIYILNVPWWYTAHIRPLGAFLMNAKAQANMI